MGIFGKREQTFGCTACGGSFGKKEELEAHVQKAHKMQAPEERRTR